MKQLGVNIDHVATLRNVRGTISYPSPLLAALYAEEGGADNITAHLREDRRHIRDQDILELRKEIGTYLNLEMAVTDEMIEIACSVQPKIVTLVPEKRQELTTEGGLDLQSNAQKIKAAIQTLQNEGIEVSLFIDPTIESVQQTLELGAKSVELHTGTYCHETGDRQLDELERIHDASVLAHQNQLHVHAGHGLHYQNIQPLLKIPEITSFQIGHAIVARAIFVGMRQAVSEMKTMLRSE